MTNEYTYKGFEIRQDGKNFDARRHYPASVHKGWPSPFIPVVRDAESVDQATKKLDDYINAQNQTKKLPILAMG